ncbi:hypothetical protein MAUB1S_07426 [Mycolicibacterium aubagnense]
MIIKSLISLFKGRHQNCDCHPQRARYIPPSERHATTGRDHESPLPGGGGHNRVRDDGASNRKVRGEKGIR